MRRVTGVTLKEDALWGGWCLGWRRTWGPSRTVGATAQQVRFVTGKKIIHKFHLLGERSG